MKLIIDLQACQSGSKYRGIGRGSYSLALEMISLALKRQHEVLVLLNKNFSNELNVLKKILEKKFPSIPIVSFCTPSPCSAGVQDNQWRHRAAELLREHLIASLAPDYVHVSTLIADGWGDDCIASINELGIDVPTALTQYDLIPLALKDYYMSDGHFRAEYSRKLNSIKKADLLLAVSEYSRREVIELLDYPSSSVVNISSAVSENFFRIPSNTEILSLYGLRPGFLLYVPGGFDYRKNLGRLIEAYAGMPKEIQIKRPLVIASKLDLGTREYWSNIAHEIGLNEGQLLFTDYVPDDHLICLYSSCYAYVFPSLHEGFGIPILEAMACGAPVIGSNRTSIPEVIGLSDALFDPYSIDDIRHKLEKVCTNIEYYELLVEHSKVQPSKFSWKRSADLAISAIEQSYIKVKAGQSSCKKDQIPSFNMLFARLNREFYGVGPTGDDWNQFKSSYEFNQAQLAQSLIK